MHFLLYFTFICIVFDFKLNHIPKYLTHKMSNLKLSTSSDPVIITKNNTNILSKYNVTEYDIQMFIQNIKNKKEEIYDKLDDGEVKWEM